MTIAHPRPPPALYCARRPNGFAPNDRTEVARAVRNLLDLAIDTSAFLPPDTISNSFDNVAETQTFSPALMEGYLQADVNARDAEGNTALHNAASRGDNEMIEFLVSKGADVRAVNRRGQTVADVANGPVQRTQPFPETLALLKRLGATLNNKCVSC